MHKLDRSLVAEPQCLSRCDHRTQNWAVGNPPLDKEEIRQALKAMQGERCAYLRRSGQLVEDLMLFNEADRKEFIHDEIEQTKDEEYWTVIRHFFEKL